MRFLRVAAIAVLGLGLPVSVAAQDFGIMNSAETINKGNFKLLANPMIIFGKNNEDNEKGLVLGGGYGFGHRFDVEARAAFYDNAKIFGADAEYWLVNKKPVNVSLIGGFHILDPDGDNDAKGVDFTALASGVIAKKLELYGGLDFARNKYDNDFKYSTWHLVPGLEYAISPQLDLDAEVGIALNDNARHYFSIGLAFYTKGK